MKKIIISIALLCYLAVSCGVIVNSHFCMDRLSSTQLFASESKICSKCGMHTGKSHGCCRDEIKIIQLKTDQKNASGISFESPVFPAPVYLPSVFITASFITLEEKGLSHHHPPPLLTGSDTYLQNRVFRI